jgi:hypothetical protein
MDFTHFELVVELAEQLGAWAHNGCMHFVQVITARDAEIGEIASVEQPGFAMC